MTSDALASEAAKTRYGFTGWVIPTAAAVCVAAIFWLAQSVIADLRELRSAKSDTVQWTLSQVEIEYLNFTLSLYDAANSDDPDLERLRKDFDVFFSRHDIIANGAVFESARQETDFHLSEKDIHAFLQQAAPLIDGSDAALVTALPTLIADAGRLRKAVGGLYVTGLAHFAESADNLRQRLSSTLLQLSAATAALVVSLILLTLYSRSASAKSHARGRELARANAHMETILATSLDAVIVSDKAGHVLDFNAAAEAIFGYKLSEIRGKLIRDLIVPPDLQAAHQAGMDRMLRTGEKKLVGKGRARLDACRANGDRFPVELALQMGNSAEGEIIVAFLRDISVEITKEEELRQARDQALAGEKAKAEFLTVMSHEIRTPLSGLLGNLSLLEKTQMSAEQRQFSENMEISGRQLMKHVNSVLDIARFESGTFRVNKAPFHLGHLLQDIIDAQSGQAEQRGTAIGWQWVGDALDWVSSDKDHIEQILMNLVGNAIKFTEHGRVDVEVEQISAADALIPTVEFRISDTGIGIAEAQQSTIFDDFVTAARAGGETGSTGLGLGIAKRLVARLGGEIGVESILGEGSVFWVRLPMAQSSPLEVPKHVSAEAEEAPRLHLLLAEDNDMNAFVVQRMLETEGHSVVWAEDGLQAVEMSKGEDFDAILMDINMPRLGGLEATKLIRTEVARAKQTPVFAFSANVLPEQTERFRESGMDGFIGKPVQIEELRAALRSVAGGRLGVITKARQPKAKDGAKAMFGDQYDVFLARFIGEGDALVDWLLQDQTSALNEVAQRCHMASSTAALFGAAQMHKALQNIEVAAARDDAATVKSLVDSLAQVWAEAKNSLEL
ncbi:ATP-binding protein [Cognatishimia sp. WU-CL00825]|uniref:hybrid sensor histidine kinase/response regulator n=1 Tax=Cognatishimia sp. WU-CL00825 TaxID=3127658 RepID=UPI003104302E